MLVERCLALRLLPTPESGRLRGAAVGRNAAQASRGDGRCNCSRFRHLGIACAAPILANPPVSRCETVELRKMSARSGRGNHAWGESHHIGREAEQGSHVLRHPLHHRVGGSGLGKRSPPVFSGACYGASGSQTRSSYVFVCVCVFPNHPPLPSAPAAQAPDMHCLFRGSLGGSACRRRAC